MVKYNKNLIKETVRKLRQQSTPSEKQLWNALRNRQFKGVKFMRQYPLTFEIDGFKRFFITDFCCHEYRLVIEIDGKIHERQKDYDELRTYIIKRLGYKVIRFKNEEVLENLDSVLVNIEKYFI